MTEIQIPLHDQTGEVVAVARVSSEDGALARRRWYRDSTGYVVRTERLGEGRRRKVYLHRAVAGLVSGDGQEVDHVDHDLLNNTRPNLRVGVHRENLQNQRHRPQRDLPRGVSWDRARKAYRATVKLGGKTNNLGRFSTAEEAARVAAAFRAEHMPWSRV